MNENKINFIEENEKLVTLTKLVEGQIINTLNLQTCIICNRKIMQDHSYYMNMHVHTTCKIWND